MNSTANLAAVSTGVSKSSNLPKSLSCCVAIAINSGLSTIFWIFGFSPTSSTIKLPLVSVLVLYVIAPTLDL